MKKSTLYMCVFVMMFSGMTFAASIDGVIETINKDKTEIYIEGKKYELMSDTVVLLDGNRRNSIDSSALKTGLIVEIKYKGNKKRKITIISIPPQ